MLLGPARRTIKFWVLLGVALSTLGPARAQDGTAQEAYLRAVGLEGEAEAIVQALEDLLAVQRPALPDARRRQTATFFGFVLAVSGVTAAQLTALEAGGLDVAHAITADARPLAEQALLADLVVVGQVQPGAPSLQEDGYDTGRTVVVEEVLKGDVPSDTLAIGQRGGPAAGALVPGERYLLLLSGGLYRFQVARHRGYVDPAAPAPQGYALYRSYRMVDQRLDWRGLSRRATRRAFSEVRRLDAALQKP